MAEQPQLDWFKSSYSGTPNNECVECAATPQAVLVRDSKSHHGGVTLSVPRPAWGEFARAVAAGRLERG